MKQEQKLIVGSEEWCSFPSLGIPAVKARVDSGAKTSSLHAFNIHAFSRGGDKWVSFEVHPIQRNRKTTVRCEAPIVDRRFVKSSSGDREKRYVIASSIHIGGSSFDIELTLSNRDTMGYRMLLGREAMSGRMLVDPAASFSVGDLTPTQLLQMYGVASEPSSGLKIGLLASNPDLYSNKRIMEAGVNRGHDMVFLDIKQCYMKLDADTPEIHYRGGWILNDIDAVIPRIAAPLTFYGCALTRHFESIGVYPLNNASSISHSRDKFYSLQLLQRKGLDIPTTGFANSPMDTSEIIDMVGGAPLIVKLLEGSQGRGVVLAETRKAGESVINAMKSLNANLLVQEFIKEAQGKDIRCFVIDGKVIASIERRAAPGEFRANLHQGGTAALVRITADERRMAIRAAKTMGLQVAGVDIIRSTKGPLLLEVNASPGLEGIETTTGKDIAGDMIGAVERSLNWRAEKPAEAENLS